VVHAYNPSYSGGKDKEDCVSRPAEANSSRDFYLENIQHKKKAGGVAPVVVPSKYEAEFKS
jgi:hypothetical protein